MPCIPKIQRKRKNKSEDEGNNEENEMFMDIIQQTIGGFGRWQCQVFLLLCLIAIPNSWTEMSIQILGHTTEFWCKPPEQYQNMSTEEWRALISVTPENSNKISVGSCMILDVLNESLTSLIACEWGYEYNRTVIHSNMITEWDFVCDSQYLVNVFQVITMSSLSLGGLTFGFAADKFGRSKSLLVALICRSIFGIVSSIARNYHLFFFLRFFLAFCDRGVIIIGLIMCLEMVAGKWKTIIPILYQLPNAIGLIIMSITTYFLRDWRIAQATLFFISAILIICHRIIPESPKWLLTVGRDNQAIDILEKAGKINDLDPMVVRTMAESFYTSTEEDVKPSTVVFLKNTNMRKRMILGCINGLNGFIVMYGLTQYMGQFSLNPYFDISLQGILAIIGILLGVFLVITCNRKLTILIAANCCGVFTLLLLAVPNQLSTIRSVVGGIAFINSIVVVSVIQPMVAELFPTIIRNSGYGIFSIFISIGALIAPFIISCGDIIWYLPLVILGIISLFEAEFILYLPENPKQALPQTVEDIEMYSFV